MALSYRRPRPLNSEARIAVDVPLTWAFLVNTTTQLCVRVKTEKVINFNCLSIFCGAVLRKHTPGNSARSTSRPLSGSPLCQLPPAYRGRAPRQRCWRAALPRRKVIDRHKSPQYGAPATRTNEPPIAIPHDKVSYNQCVTVSPVTPARCQSVPLPTQNRCM